MLRIMERDGRLEDLENKADKLHIDSQQFQVRLYPDYRETKVSKCILFQKAMVKVKRRAWLEHMRTKLLVAATVAVLLIILASVLAYEFYYQ